MNLSPCWWLQIVMVDISDYVKGTPQKAVLLLECFLTLLNAQLYLAGVVSVA